MQQKLGCTAHSNCWGGKTLLADNRAMLKLLSHAVRHSVYEEKPTWRQASLTRQRSVQQLHLHKTVEVSCTANGGLLTAQAPISSDMRPGFVPVCASIAFPLVNTLVWPWLWPALVWRLFSWSHQHDAVMSSPQVWGFDPPVPSLSVARAACPPQKIHYGDTYSVASTP